jgi:hypothetical protein
LEFASARIPGNLLLKAYAGLAKEKTMARVAVVVIGAGGLIVGHLVWALLDEGRSVRAVDIKLLDEWFRLAGKLGMA